MRKLTTAVCLSAALLASSGAQAQWQYNWLLGVSGAYGWSDVDVDFSLFNSLDGDTLTFNDEFDNNGWQWGVLGGFQAKCNRFSMGLELNVDWPNEEDDDRNFLVFDDGVPESNLAVSFDRDAVVALTARFGYDITPWLMGYVRAGVETYEEELNFASATVPAVGNFVTASDSERRVWGFVGGVGAEVPVPIITGLSFRAEWNYHSHGKSVDATGLSSDNVTFETVSVKQDSVNTVKASLVLNLPV